MEYSSLGVYSSSYQSKEIQSSWKLDEFVSNIYSSALLS